MSVKKFVSLLKDIKEESTIFSVIAKNEEKKTTKFARENCLTFQ